MGLYRENAIAIESEARDPFGGNVFYVTMQITFPIPEFARKERNLHCDVAHVTTKWVSMKQPTISVLSYYLQVLDIRMPHLSTVDDIAIYSHNNKQKISRFAHRLMGTPSSRYLMPHHEVTVSAVISKVI